MTENRIVIEKLNKYFKIGAKKSQTFLSRVISILSGREPQKIIQALRNVSLEVKSGEILGIMGDNGSGKSTLLRIIAGIYKPDSGRVETFGKIVILTNLYVGLKERMIMRDNIYFFGSLLGLSNRQIDKKFSSIVEFSGLSSFQETKIYQFSTGMMQRLVFSIAVHADPKILLLDEIFEVGDEDFKEKSAAKIRQIVGNGGCVALVSHDLSMIKKYCNRTIYIKNGEIIKDD